MKVKELIEYLQGIDPEHDVIIVRTGQDQSTIATGVLDQKSNWLRSVTIAGEK